MSRYSPLGRADAACDETACTRVMNNNSITIKLSTLRFDTLGERADTASVMTTTTTDVRSTAATHLITNNYYVTAKTASAAWR